MVYTTLPGQSGTCTRTRATLHRQLIWDYLLAQTAPSSAAMVAHAVGITVPIVDRYMRRLLDAGFIVASADKPELRSLVKPASVVAPRFGVKAKSAMLGAELANMWRAMRMLKTFSPRDLAAHCTTPDVEVTELQARNYCRALLEVGYLRVLEKATTTRPARYRLVEDTGPQAPTIRLVPRVWDANVSRMIEPVAGPSTSGGIKHGRR
jgi:hypothetical protein